jgi:hypothetical protein
LTNNLDFCKFEGIKMPRRRVVLSLSFALSFVGGALWLNQTLTRGTTKKLPRPAPLPPPTKPKQGDNDPVDLVEIGSEQLKLGGVYKVKPLGSVGRVMSVAPPPAPRRLPPLTPKKPNPPKTKPQTNPKPTTKTASTP